MSNLSESLSLAVYSFTSACLAASQDALAKSIQVCSLKSV